MCGVVIRELPAAAPTLGTIACWPQPPAHAPRVRHGQATCHVSMGQWADRLSEMMRAGHRVTTNHLLTLLFKLVGLDT